MELLTAKQEKQIVRSLSLVSVSLAQHADSVYINGAIRGRGLAMSQSGCCLTISVVKLAVVQAQINQL